MEQIPDVWSPKIVNPTVEVQLFRKIYQKGEYYDNGIVAMTPSGRRLAREKKNYVDERKALAEWRQFPEEERRPGRVKLENLIDNPKAQRSPTPMPPPGGLIVKICLRALARGAGGELRHTEPGDFRSARSQSYQAAMEANRAAGVDFMWMTEAEWKSLIPPTPKAGDVLDWPERVRDRVCLMHLVDGVRNLASPWRRADLRAASLKLTVTHVSAAEVRLRLEGTALMANDANLAKATIGYDVRLLGYLTYEKQKGAFSRLDLVAVGDYWDVNDHHNTGARPGRAPLGFAFELTRGATPADRIPPGVYRYTNYFENKYPR